MTISKSDNHWFTWPKFLDVVPTSCRPLFNPVIDFVAISGPILDEVVRILPGPIRKHHTEIYLGIFAANTILLESYNNSLAFVTPLSFITQIGLNALLYGRVLIELALMEDTPHKKDPRDHFTSRAAFSDTGIGTSSGSLFYKFALLKIRQPWNNYHTATSIACAAIGISILFSAQSLPIILLRLVTATAVGIFLLAKHKQSVNLKQQREDLQQWVEAAPNPEEQNSRLLAKQEILRYQKAEQFDRCATMDVFERIEHSDKPEYTFLHACGTLEKEFHWPVKSAKHDETGIPLNKISFRNLKLTSLPDQLWELTTIRTLDLEGNLFDYLSCRISELPYLEKVFLADNPMIESLPSTLETLDFVPSIYTENNPKLQISSKMADTEKVYRPSGSRSEGKIVLSVSVKADPDNPNRMVAVSTSPPEKKPVQRDENCVIC